MEMWSYNKYVIFVNLINIFFFSCQFVVKEGADYSLYLSNPDELVDWNQIEEIVSIFYMFIWNEVELNLNCLDVSEVECYYILFPLSPKNKFNII